MCCKSSNSCPANRKKNGTGVARAGIDYSRRYQNLPQETKDRMRWSKGLTKETDLRVSRPLLKGKRFGASLTGHTEEAKHKISIARTEWLKNPQNRKNLGRHKRSWMELTFESYLNDNNIIGWESEVHFWNAELGKNYFPDFIFESKKLIIELDGTQHRLTVEQDRVRDEWFTRIGYKVVRIPIAEFKQRYFSGVGFLDLLGH